MTTLGVFIGFLHALLLLPFAFGMYRFFVLRKTGGLATGPRRVSALASAGFVLSFAIVVVMTDPGAHRPDAASLVFFVFQVVLFSAVATLFERAAFLACLLTALGGQLISQTLLEMYALRGPVMREITGDIGDPSSSQVGIVSHLNYYLFRPVRGAIVAVEPEKSAAIPVNFQSNVPSRFHVSQDIGTYFGRVVGLPGESIELLRSTIRINGVLLREPYVRGEIATGTPLKISLGSSDYLLAEDWRKMPDSAGDCNPFYVVHERQVAARQVFVLWPWANFGLVRPPDYNVPDPSLWKLRINERWLERLSKM